MTSITIPEKVEYLGTFAFYGCTNVTELHYNVIKELSFASSKYSDPREIFGNIGRYGDGVTVYIGENVTKIPDNMFYSVEGEQYNIAELVFEGESLMTIGNSAFYGRTGLTNFNLPNSLITIGNNAFVDCTGLTSITIPEKVEYIGSFAFYGCTNVTELHYNVIRELSFPSSKYDDPREIFGNIGTLGEGVTVYIGKNVTKIPDCMFYSVEGETYNVASVVFESTNLLTIGDSAFAGCVMLGGTDRSDTFVIPDTVVTIGNNAFSGCVGIQNLTLPQNDTAICGGAFYGCTGLTSISIPETITSLGSFAFYNCTSVTELHYNVIKELSFASSKYDDPREIFGNIGRYGDGVTVYIGENVTKIPDRMFYSVEGEQYNIAELVFEGENLMTIGSSAFYGCTGLTNFNLPNSLITIGNNAFVGCTGLTSITIPEKVEYIGSFAFYGCTNVTELHYNVIRELSFVSGKYDDPREIFGNIGRYSTGVTLYVGKNVTKIPDCMFYSVEGEQYNIVRVIFAGASLKTIGSSAFYGCTGLTNLNLPNSLITIGNNAFVGCTGLTSITIPENVEYIGSYAFYDCTSVTELHYDTTKELGFSSDKNSGVYLIFGNLGKLTPGVTVYFGDDMVKVPDYMFHVCASEVYNVTAVVFEGDRVAKIGNYAFSGCNVLESALYDSCDLFWSFVTVGAGNEPLTDKLVYRALHGTDIETVLQEATCGQDGCYLSVCRGCGIVIGTQVIPAKGHMFSESIQHATCTEDGSKSYVCAVCGYSYVDVIPALGHDYAETVTEPFCATPGIRHYACAVCDHAYGVSIPAPGHDYVDGVCTACGKTVIVEYGVELSVSDAKAFAGDTVTVDVLLDKNVGFTFIKLGVNYDTDALELISVANGVMFEQMEQGKYYVWADAENVAGTGVLATLTFAIKPNAAAGDVAVSVIVMECSNADEQDVPVLLKSGTVTVLEHLVGDCNGDNVINGKDMTRLLRYLMFLDPVTGESSVEVTRGADVNRDGKINGADATRLLRYLAHLDPVTGESSITLG